MNEEENKKLKNKLKSNWKHIKYRIKNKKCYKSVTNGFKKFIYFYIFIKTYLKKYNLYKDFMDGKLEIDKDAGSFMLYGDLKKTYSPLTVNLITKEINIEIRNIINNDNLAEEDKKCFLKKLLKESGVE